MVTPEYLLLQSIQNISMRQQYKETKKMIHIGKENWIEPKELKIKKVQEWNAEKHEYDVWYELYGIFDFKNNRDVLLGCTCWKYIHNMVFNNSDWSNITKFETVDEAIETYKQCHEDMLEHPRKEEFVDMKI